MNNEIFDKVTIIIPTFNRYPYLLRLLNYYRSYNFPMRILILDSSTDLLEQDKFQDLLSNSKICYQKINSDFVTRVLRGLKDIPTPYSVFCSDDDFVVPNGIKKSVDFLENNPDFTVAHGRYISFWLQDSKDNKQQFLWMPGYPFFSITFPGSKQRLIYHFLHYSPTFYGTHRSDFLRLIFEEAKDFTDSNRFGELLLSMLTLIYGKMKCLDVFYAARQNLANSVGKKSKKLIDFIKDGTYSDRYGKFRDCLGKHLSNKAELDIEEAKKVIDNAMSVYLSDKEHIRYILIRRIKDISKNSILLDWIYQGTRLLYRKLFPTRKMRMDDSMSFAHTHFSKYYDEVSNIYKHLLFFPISDKKG